MSWFEQGIFLERYPVSRWDCGLFGKVPLGTVWESGQNGKVPEAWFGLEGISFVEGHVSGMKQLDY
jgi:hypothetical protein